MASDAESLDRKTEQAWSRHAVLQIITDLYAVGKRATRDVICGETNLPMVRVDSFVKDLKTDGLIRSVAPGEWEPIDQTLPRAVSGTMVPGGRFKLEIGDTCLDLSMREARMVATLTGGVVLNFGR